jgi:acetyl-CoA C-acetyltransferase
MRLIRGICADKPRLLGALADRKADDLERGVVTLCIGGGQGIALAIETIS